MDEPLEEDARPQKPTALFERFLALADADDTAVLKFARLYGTLGLCRHGVPMTIVGAGNCRRHLWRPEEHVAAGPRLCCEGERPEDWRKWARRFTAAIEVAAALRDHKTPSASAVERLLEPADHFDTDNTRTALLGGFPDGPPPAISEILPVCDRLRALETSTTTNRQLSHDAEILQRWYFSGLINRWLRTPLAIASQASATPRVWLEAGTSDLFSTLALQLALVVTETTSLVLCSVCHRPTERQRQPPQGVPSWCLRLECQRVKARLTSKRRRKRRRATALGMVARLRSC